MPLWERARPAAMGPATLELRPGSGVGPFVLGMPVCEALAHIEQQPALFETTHVKYSEKEPLKWDLVVAFPNLGFHLRFDPHSQRLRLIEVYDLTRLQLRYAASTVGGPSVAATFVRVYATLGPTFPGTYDEDRGIYTLFYPGLALSFPIPPQYSDTVLLRQAELPLEFLDGTTPVAARVRVFAGSGPLVGRAQPPPLPPSSLYMEEVQGRLGEGLRFMGGGQSLHFGASPQDVWAELGRPCMICPKQVDRMLIHSAPDGPSKASAACQDYVYNYFTRGIDILFDAQTQRIKKFVLHTNFPGHADFNVYIKCNFTILCGPEGAARSISADAKWDHVQEILGEGGRAAIQARGSTSNPFGPSYVYAFRHVAFEVMRNGHIATVTLFQAPPF